MARVRREDLAEPVLGSEVVAVAELGGDVEVKALPLDVLQSLLGAARSNPDRAVASFLASTVLSDDGAPLWPAEKWLVWGGAHVHAAMRLYAAAQRVCGIGAEAAEIAAGKSDAQIVE